MKEKICICIRFFFFGKIFMRNRGVIPHHARSEVNNNAPTSPLSWFCRAGALFSASLSLSQSRLLPGKTGLVY